MHATIAAVLAPFVNRRADSCSAASRMEMKNGQKLLALAGFGALTAGAAALGSRARPDRWFRSLAKPWFEPPPWVFKAAWTALYSLIAVSGYRVWSARPSAERTAALTFWGAQLGLNAVWPLLFFGQHSPKAAFADLGLLRLSVDAYVEAAEKVDPAARWMMAPYRGWLGFATLLNRQILEHNPA